MRRRLINTLVAVTTALALTGCANGYKEFYIPATGVSPEFVSANRASAAPALPVIERSPFGDLEKIIAGYSKRGYVVIGESSFNSGENVSEDHALKQGAAVGADLVLVFVPQYTGSVTSSMPLTTPKRVPRTPQAVRTPMGRVVKPLLSVMHRLRLMEAPRPIFLLPLIGLTMAPFIL